MNKEKLKIGLKESTKKMKLKMIDFGELRNLSLQEKLKHVNWNNQTLNADKKS